MTFANYALGQARCATRRRRPSTRGPHLTATTPAALERASRDTVAILSAAGWTNAFASPIVTHVTELAVPAGLTATVEYSVTTACTTISVFPRRNSPFGSCHAWQISGAIWPAALLTAVITVNEPPSAESAHEPDDIAPVLIGSGWREHTELLGGGDLLWQTWTSPDGSDQVRFSPAFTDDFVEWTITRGPLRFTATEGTPAAVISALALAPTSTPAAAPAPTEPPTAIEAFDHALMHAAAARAAYAGILRTDSSLDLLGTDAEVLAASLRELADKALTAAEALLAADHIPA